MNRRNVIITIVIAVVVVVSGATAYALYGGAGSTQTKSNTGNNTTAVTLTETGSSLLYPAFNLWKQDYSAAKITTASTGSGTGIAQAEKGTVNIGASDAFIQGTIPPGVMNIPILISYQYISYNIPGVNQTLNLNAAIIAGIYMGTITNWNDSLIQQANPNVTLPSHTIIPVHRSDGSGDTFMFTSFLSKANSTWASEVGASVNPNWPALSTALTGNGNQGIIDQMNSTQYTIGYIAATYSSEVKADGFGIADLLNQAGHYVAPTVANVKQAAAQYLSAIPVNGTIALQFAPGNSSYPIADMEYVIVQVAQPSQQVANALQAFLAWIVNSTSGGSQSKYLAPLDLAPLPSSVVSGITLPLINKITG